MSYLFRIIKFSLQDFYRNIWLSLVTISILILTLVSINVLIAFQAVTGTAVQVIKDKVDVSIDFKSTASVEEIGGMKDYIIGLPEVDGIEYISKAEALEIFKEKHSDNEMIIEVVDELDDNPLGAIVRVKARNLDSYETILQAIDKPEFNELVASRDYYNRQEMINKVSSWTKTGEKVALIFIAFFVLVSALIVFNTIRVAIYTHREEIGIEKLVGATNWFVSLPFIIESIFYALIACLVTIGLIYPLLSLTQPYLVGFFGSNDFDLSGYFNQHFLVIFVGEFLVISLVNVISSYIAARKYLKM